MRKIYNVEIDFIGSRLDKWIKKVVSKVPQSLIEKSLRKGKIKVNNLKVKSSYKLHKDDQIIFNNIFFKKEKVKQQKKLYIPTKKELSFSSTIFIENNENFAVINKPAGISVQSGTKSKRNIIDLLRKTEEFKESLPFPVHRIDKETTGILIVAKNRKYAQLFTSLFRIRKIHKTYLGITFGAIKDSKGVFIDELFYYEGDKKIKMKAITRFSVLDTNGNYSLLKLNPETGRKHQLRKQLLIHGIPILGDSKYRLSFKKNVKKDALMLHAYKINFSINGLKYNFLAKTPKVFDDMLKEKFLKIS